MKEKYGQKVEKFQTEIEVLLSSSIQEIEKTSFLNLQQEKEKNSSLNMPKKDHQEIVREMEKRFKNEKEELWEEFSRIVCEFKNQRDELVFEINSLKQTVCIKDDKNACLQGDKVSVEKELI